MNDENKVTLTLDDAASRAVRAAITIGVHDGRIVRGVEYDVASGDREPTVTIHLEPK